MEQGVISEEEFDSAKKKILGIWTKEKPAAAIGVAAAGWLSHAMCINTLFKQIYYTSHGSKAQVYFGAIFMPFFRKVYCDENKKE